jgi:purine-binding chemotaxis protein CheW
MSSVSISEPTGTQPPRGQSLVHKYLTFALANEEYGLPVLKVREIIKMMDITEVPQVPAHVKGVVNLRGKVIPVVDLRLTFGLPSREYDERTCIIVAEVELPEGRVMMGMAVDSVSEVVSIPAADIEDTPSFGGRINTEYVRGLAKVRGRVKIVLDIDKVFGGQAF